MAYIIVRRARNDTDNPGIHLVAVPRAAIKATLVTSPPPTATKRPIPTPTTAPTPPPDPDESVRYSGGDPTLHSAVREWYKLHQRPFVAGEHGPVSFPLDRPLPPIPDGHVLVPSNALSLFIADGNSLSIEDRAFLAAKTADEITTGGIEQVRSWSDVSIILPAFVAKHPVTGKRRIIFDGRALNRYLKAAAGSVRYESVRDVLTLQGSASTKLDLMSAFRHVEVADAHKKMLGFIVEGRVYRYRCLPFGVSWSPALYLTLLRPVIDQLRRNHKISIVWYVDDLIIVARDVRELDAAVARTLQLLAAHGWKAAPDKTYCTAFQVLPFLGLLVDLTGPTPRLRIPKAKTADLGTLISNALETGRTTVNVLQRIAGKLNFLRIVAPELGLFRRPLDAAIASVATSSLNTSIPIIPRSSLAEHLAALYSICGRLPGLWIAGEQHDGRTRRSVYSDASADGWGVLLLDTDGTLIHTPPEVRFDGDAGGTPPIGYTAGGKFSDNELAESSAAREIRAISNGIVALDLRDAVLSWHSDATAAVGAIRKWSSRSAGVIAALCDLFHTVRSRNLHLSVTHVLRECEFMPVADWLSRVAWRDKQAEWAFDTDDFRRLENCLGLSFTADMFATAQNTHVPSSFCSRFIENGSRGDAFFTSWPGETWWAFPPVSLRRRIISRLLWYHDVYLSSHLSPTSAAQPPIPPFTLALILPPIAETSPDSPDWARLCSLRRKRRLPLWSPRSSSSSGRSPFFSDLRLRGDQQSWAPGPPPWPLELSLFEFKP